MLIDTHCHLNFGAFKRDAHEIAKECLEKNVWMINVGSQSTTSQRAVDFAQEFPQGVYAAVGLHPSHLFEMEVSEEEIEFESRAEEFDYDFYKKLASSDKVVAIGESGLDYHFMPKAEELASVKQKQIDIFHKHLELGSELDLPIIIHARDTYEEIIGIIQTFLDKGRLKRRGVLHCFLGTWDQAKKFLDMGFLISFTGIITFKPKKYQADQQANLIEVVKNTPLDRMMVETDAPFLSPEPYRGKRNLPWYVEEVAKKIAEIKGVSNEEVFNETTKTAKQFFKL